jgi:transposase InsO family protein
VNRLTKTAYFISINIRYSLEKLAQLYILEIVHLHGVISSIVSDRGPRFTSRFWKKFQESLGSDLIFSTSAHPQTNGQLERVIQIFKDTLRALCVGFWK